VVCRKTLSALTIVSGPLIRQPGGHRWARRRPALEQPRFRPCPL